MRRVPALSLALLVALVGLSVPAAAHAINHLSADPQVSADGTVVIESAYATEDGFLVLYRDWDGSSGEVVGVRPFSAATRDVTEVEASVNASVWSSLPANTTLTAVLHADADGDGRFDPSTDAPLSSFGRATQATFTVRDGADRAYVSAAGAAPQRTMSNVTVRAVTLPADGHLVIRTSTGGEPGAVLGSVPLEAGVHRNVSVSLDSSYLASRNGTFAVFAMAYTDDGNGELDGGDRPVFAGEEYVATRFSVDPSPEGSVINTPTDWTDGVAPAIDSSGGTTGDGPGFGPSLAVLAGVFVLGSLALWRGRGA
jgi:hypothetical protein